MSTISKPTVLVTGATGAQGGAVVSELLKADNVTIRAMTRNPSAPKAQALASKGVQVVKADMSDAASLGIAMAGVDRAFLLTDPTGPKGAALEEENGKLFIAIAKEAGDQHLVFNSVGDANNHSGVPHFDSKFAIEQTLKASGIPSWTILRPAAFMENLPTEAGIGRAMGLGVFGSLLGGKSLKLVAVQDIGFFAARALEDPQGWNKKEMMLAGDDLTVEEMKVIYAKVHGSRPTGVWIPTSMLGVMLPKDLSLMFKFFREDRGDAVDIPSLRRMDPGLQTLEQWLRSKNQTSS